MCRYYTKKKKCVMNSFGNIPSLQSPNLQLCVRGCPSSERINYKEFLSYPNQKIKTLMRHNEIAMTRELAIIQCREVRPLALNVSYCPFLAPPPFSAIPIPLCLLLPRDIWLEMRLRFSTFLKFVSLKGLASCSWGTASQAWGLASPAWW